MANDWSQRWKSALREQHELLFDYDKKALKEEYALYVACPICSKKENHTELMFEKDWFKYYRCKTCSLVFMNPRLNNDATAAFYNSNVNAIYNEMKFDAITESTEMDDRINSDNLIVLDSVRSSMQKGSLLEIGCAKGLFLQQAKNAGYKVWGLELNKKNCSIAQKSLGNTILDVDLESAHFDNATFDVVYMRDVIEHLPNPTKLFIELNRIMKPNGILFIDTHNIDSLINSIVREKHVVIFGFEHPTHWSPQSLRALFLNTGFAFKTVQYRSDDFTIRNLLLYLIAPAFTTILPAKHHIFIQYILKVIIKPFALWPLHYLDKTFTPKIAQMLKKGSTMKVFAEKI